MREIGVSSSFELDDFTGNRLALDCQESERNRQSKTPRSGTARVEIKNAIAPLLKRLMRMARDYSRESCPMRFEVQVVYVVDDIENHIPEFQRRSFGENAGPGFPIDIPADSCQRRDPAQLFQDRPRAHIPRMDYMIHTAQRRQRLGSGQPVGVGNDSHPQLPHLLLPSVGIFSFFSLTVYKKHSYSVNTPREIRSMGTKEFMEPFL